MRNQVESTPKRPDAGLGGGSGHQGALFWQFAHPLHRTQAGEATLGQPCCSSVSSASALLSGASDALTTFRPLQHSPELLIGPQ